uniref:Uncharacterized protein n=1 Tax=Rhizophora mucronata TaxID=61149 RepID=A0A2P2K8E5_RHIMU
MGPDLETKEKSRAPMEVLVGKENERSPQDPKDKRTNNSEGKKCNVEAAHGGQDEWPDGTKEVEVDILECRNSVQFGEAEAGWRDATESSMSSFGDTVSESEDGPMLSDTEVESRLGVADGSESMFNDFDGLIPIRRKRLTDHWRRFIRPLMWRCKWIELQIKELQSQALKYNKELVDHEHKKQFDFETFLVEGFHAKSHPFSSCAERKVMKRKKRKKLEETTDIGTYMRQHNLFSYYENQRSAAIGTSLGEDHSNLGKKINFRPNT